MNTLFQSSKDAGRKAASRPAPCLTYRSGCQGRLECGFTMVEIAIALGVIAFALVAIIGVLPAGLQVQKEVNERTIIKQDAVFFMNAIRSGVRDEDDLTNYVEEVFITNHVTSVTSSYVYQNGFRNGGDVIGLLSHTNAFETVQAWVRAISGVASDRSQVSRDLAFRYLMTVELEPMSNANPDHPDRQVLEGLLWDLRLTFEWPVLANGGVGGEEALYRSMVMAAVTNDPPNSAYYFFKQDSFPLQP